MQTFIVTQEKLNAIPAQDRGYKLPGVTHPGEYTWNEARNTYIPVREPAPDESEPEGNAFDFDSTGLGIGGLGRFVEPIIIPTVEQIERVQRMERTARHCRICGQSELDGAMFTTMAGGDICDDCF